MAFSCQVAPKAVHLATRLDRYPRSWIHVENLEFSFYTQRQASPSERLVIAPLRYSGEAILCRLPRDRNRERGYIFVACSRLREIRRVKRRERSLFTEARGKGVLGRSHLSLCKALVRFLLALTHLLPPIGLAPTPKPGLWCPLEV